jgi:hypothetical protein
MGNFVTLNGHLKYASEYELHLYRNCVRQIGLSSIAIILTRLGIAVVPPESASESQAAETDKLGSRIEELS